MKVFFVVLVLLLAVPVSTFADNSVISCLGVDDENWNRVVGENIWVGYENGGFDMPRSYIYGVVQFDNGTELWVYYSRETPEYYYVMPFRNLKPHGDPYGVHPCGAFSIDHDSNAYLVLSTMSEPTVIYDRYNPDWLDRALKIIRGIQWETE